MEDRLDQEAKELLIRIDERTHATDEKIKNVVIKHLDDHNTRIRKVERRQQWLFGLGSGLAFIGGVGLAWLKTKLGIH